MPLKVINTCNAIFSYLLVYKEVLRANCLFSLYEIYKKPGYDFCKQYPDL